MSSFHKPKMFRSSDGCCICKAKSSSSRFTDSSKYEEDFQRCFRPETERFGDICNACVLLVKRWRKLPKSSTRNWAHVVDSRAGPGGKSFVKKKLEKPEVFHKIRRKVKPTKLKPKKEAEERSASPLSDESFCSEVGVPEAKKRLEENEVTDFFASPYWKREEICCGVVFRGLLGEVMIDPRLYRKCPRLVHGKVNKKPNSVSVASLIESELKKLSHSIDNKEITPNEYPTKTEKDKSDHENDEGFCDKESTITSPSSPESCRAGSEEY